MDREVLAELWGDMWKEGNWIPTWPDSLADLTAESAAWTPGAGCHSVWEETIHVIFWRDVTLRRMAGMAGPSDQEVERLEFAAPAVATESAWQETVASLKRTHDELAAAIASGTGDLARLRCHLIHDGYHLGRITQLRAMQGTAPKF